MTDRNQQDRQFWDDTWKTWVVNVEAPDTASWRNEMENRRLDFLTPHLHRGGRIVEIGAGSGRLLARLGKATGANLIGVDYSVPSMRLLGATAAAFGVRIAPVGGDAYRLPIRTGAVEMVVSGGLLEHFEDPRPLLSEMVRILKPNGLFYAGVVPRRLFSLHRPMHRIAAPDVYRSSFGVDDYRRWLSELGCTDIVAWNVGVYPPLMQHLPTPLRRGIEGAFRGFDGTPIAHAVGYGILLLARKGSG